MQSKINKFILTENEYDKYIKQNGGYSKYTLNYEQYKKSLNTVIISLLSCADISKTPTSSFVVSQPGSGKTGLATHVLSTIEPSSVKIDPDLIATYHQKYNEIIDEIPNQSYTELQKFVRTALNNTLRPLGVEQNLNLLSEGTFADTNGYLDIIRHQKNSGYKIDIHTIVTHRLESLLSAFERQQSCFSRGLPPRVVLINHHDNAYNQIFETFDKIISEQLFDEINIYTRGEKEYSPKLKYKFDKANSINVKNTIQFIRNQELEKILSNPTTYSSRISNLKNQILQNPDSLIKTQQLTQLSQLENDFKKELSSKEIHIK